MEDNEGVGLFPSHSLSCTWSSKLRKQLVRLVFRQNLGIGCVAMKQRWNRGGCPISNVQAENWEGIPAEAFLNTVWYQIHCVSAYFKSISCVFLFPSLLGHPKHLHSTLLVGNSLAVEWLGLSTFISKAWVWSLVGELRSCKPHNALGGKKKNMI